MLSAIVLDFFAFHVVSYGTHLVKKLCYSTMHVHVLLYMLNLE